LKGVRPAEKNETLEIRQSDLRKASLPELITLIRKIGLDPEGITTTGQAITLISHHIVGVE
jgi:hypothetical protein